MENNAIVKLETKFRELVEQCHELQHENDELKQRVEQMQQKQVLVGDRVNRVLNQLRMLEEES